MKRVLFSAIIMLVYTISTSWAEFAIVPIQDTIDGGLAAFVERSIGEAETETKDGIIFHIDYTRRKNRQRYSYKGYHSQGKKFRL